jgi:hypothetical protein
MMSIFNLLGYGPEWVCGWAVGSTGNNCRAGPPSPYIASGRRVPIVMSVALSLGMKERGESRGCNA